MNTEWKDFINKEMEKEYMHALKKFVAERRNETVVLPDAKQLFDAFKYCPYNDLKVVIIGQDPYPTRKDAHGLAFSSLDETETPYSLANIFTEIKMDIFFNQVGKTNIFQHNDLTQWAQQGVLLLNSCLTTEENAPGAHKGKGWEYFLENSIKFVNEHPCRLVFMLWGKEAQKVKQWIDLSKHLVLEAEHPASVRFNPNAWFGCKHFSKANAFIRKHYMNFRPEIGWGIWNNPLTKNQF